MWIEVKDRIPNKDVVDKLVERGALKGDEGGEVCHKEVVRKINIKFYKN